MIVDSSALVAIVLGEPDAERYRDALLGAGGTRRLCTVNAVESAIVVEARQGGDAARDLDLLIETAGIEVEAVEPELVVAVIEAWRRFGRGRHPAALNFGDCFAYSLSRLHNEPLLFKGSDFSQTDVASVL